MSKKLNNFFQAGRVYVVNNRCSQTKILKRILKVEKNQITWKDMNEVVTELWLSDKTSLYYNNQFKFVNNTVVVSNLVYGAFLTVEPWL